MVVVVDFAVSADQWMKMKESELIDKYLDLARELKKLWNKKVTAIAIVVGALETVPSGFEKSLEELELIGRIETIQTTSLLDRLEYLEDLRRLTVTKRRRRLITATRNNTDNTRTKQNANN